ncbi:hypothetical protein SOM61_14345 [Massilia sp. CFBP9012]|uniref:hypothetical protein n=1 Tax=Massilia sp. CFBP9012 TaxID=3096531 RepID=UPI002A69F327|nr:hypothetical protein [Massilia sp. CFBP9012]MDY0976150.1 hypothetical protein [Massilia sp. CFBP9012]
MATLTRIVRGACACALAGAAFAASAHASAQDAAPAGTDATVNPTVARQQAHEIAKGDPPRWYRDDPAQQTLRKELGAALQEAQNACRKAPTAERKSCMQEARATWQRETAQLGKSMPRQ